METFNPIEVLLNGLEAATREIANTWRPDDPEYLADLQRQMLMSLSSS